MIEELARRRNILSNACNFLQTAKPRSPIQDLLDVDPSTKQQISRLMSTSLLKNQEGLPEAQIDELAEMLESDDDQTENDGTTNFTDKLNKAVTVSEKSIPGKWKAHVKLP